MIIYIFLNNFHYAYFYAIPGDNRHSLFQGNYLIKILLIILL